MNAIEILALIFAAFVILKTIVFSISPKSWQKMPKAVMTGNTALLTIVYLILTAIVGYYVLPLGIVNIAAAFLLMTLLLAIAAIPYMKDILKAVKVKDCKKSWIAIVIWLAIAIAVLYTLFA